MRSCLIVVVFLLFSCRNEPPEYKTLMKDVAFKYHQFGEGAKPNIGETIEVSLMITEQNDTLHYVPDYPYFIKLKGEKLDSAWMYLKEGDSATFKIQRAEINKRFKFYEVLQSDTGQVFLHMRLTKVHEEAIASTAKKKAIALRELEEQRDLRTYLKNSEDKWEEVDGIYKVVVNETEGDSVRYGSEVSIHYKGKFLNGYIFDNTYEKGITPTFIYGKEYQLIDGMKVGLKNRREGESVKIILPSRRAFGEEGSLAGIVPPYTAVIFEVEIIKVIN